MLQNKINKCLIQYTYFTGANMWYISTVEYDPSLGKIRWQLTHQITQATKEYVDTDIYKEFNSQEIATWMQSKGYMESPVQRITIVHDLTQVLRKKQHCELKFQGEVLLRKKWDELASMFAWIAAQGPSGSIDLDKQTPHTPSNILKVALSCAFEDDLSRLRDAFNWHGIDHGLEALELLGIQGDKIGVEDIRVQIVDQKGLKFPRLSNFIQQARSAVGKAALTKQQKILHEKYANQKWHWIRKGNVAKGFVRAPFRDLKESIIFNWLHKIDKDGDISFATTKNYNAISQLIANLKSSDGPWVAQTLEKRFKELESQLWTEKLSMNNDFVHVMGKFMNKFGATIAEADKSVVSDDLLWYLIQIDLDRRIVNEDMADWFVSNENVLNRLSLNRNETLIEESIDNYCDHENMNESLLGLIENYFKMKQNGYGARGQNHTLRKWFKWIFDECGNEEAGTILTHFVANVKSSQELGEIALIVVDYFMHDYDTSFVKPANLVQFVNDTMGFAGWNFNASHD